MIICMLYHPSHEKQVRVVSEYYESIGYVVDCVEADFLKKPEHEYRNDFYKRHPGDKYALHIDSDEIILPEDMTKLEQSLQGDIIRCNIIDYVDECHVISPLRPHKPIVATKTGVMFYNNRNAGQGFSGRVIDVNIHHLGYIEKVLEWKIRNYIKRNEIHELGNCSLIQNSARDFYDTPPEVSKVMEALA